jgi:GH15 family glucan-1,4-alpha-glucosidase
MGLRIEDYALIGNMHTAALVGRDGSIDWLCVPRFDSPACFAALLGSSEHGRWLIAPDRGVKAARRNYRGDTLILETIFETDDGEVALIDFMPIREQAGQVDLIRLVEGRKGSVSMQMELYHL